MLVLASQSPRRLEILERAGIAVAVRFSAVTELRAPGEAPSAYAMRLAEAKAKSVPRFPGEVILGADTIVVAEGRVLEKPRAPQDARDMLNLLSGREHSVITGVCLLHAAGCTTIVEETRVRFASLTEAEIAAYVATGEPMDKAGAYAIQGLASKFVERVEGCYFNVVGLPIARVYRLLKNLDADLLNPSPTLTDV